MLTFSFGMVYFSGGFVSTKGGKLFLHHFTALECPGGRESYKPPIVNLKDRCCTLLTAGTQGKLSDLHTNMYTRPIRVRNCPRKFHSMFVCLLNFTEVCLTCLIRLLKHVFIYIYVYIYIWVFP